MNFIGRERELKQLETIYHNDGFQMVVMYGRRRVGKTTLLNKFMQGKRAVYYMATRSSSEENLREFSRAVTGQIFQTGSAMQFAGYQDAFHYITEHADRTSDKFVLILDEYPYLLESTKDVSSVLQKIIDQEWLHCNIMLVLCGSSISMMEDEVLSEKSPLYGRRTAQLDIKPFDYLMSSLFTPDYRPEDKAVCYGITGGIPKYLSMLNPDVSVDENIENLYFDDSGFLYEEPENLLQQEFRNVASYNSVLQAIANGAVQISEISQKTHLDSSLVSQMLNRLIRIRVIRRDEPVPSQHNKRYTQYVLNDGMFRFWYRYVAPARGAIERGYGKEYYENRIQNDIHDYMGKEFEVMCQEYVWNHASDFVPEVFISNVGKWRGQDNVKKKPADIDVVGIDEMGKTAVIGECKFKNEPIGENEYETLRDRARLIRPYEVRNYLLFSLSGFKNGLKVSDDTHLVSLKDMYPVR